MDLPPSIGFCIDWLLGSKYVREFCIFFVFGGYLYWLRCAMAYWAGVLVCGFRAQKFAGLRKLRPHVELQSRMGQAERLGNGAETKRPTGQAMTH